MKTILKSLALGLCTSIAALPALAETTLEKIRREGVITVGTEAAFPPFEYVENGQIVGYGKDILDVVVAELGVELRQLDLPFQGILPGLLAGNFDLVATSLGINEERATRYAFTAPIIDAVPAVLSRKGEAVTSLDELAGKVVATQLASNFEPIVRDLSAKLTAEGKGFGDLKLYTAFPDAYMALASGEVDAVIQNRPALAVLVKERPDVFDLGADVRSEGQYTHFAWAARAEDKDLRDFVSSVIYRMQDDGRLQDLQMKWFGTTFEIPKEGYLPPGSQ